MSHELKFTPVAHNHEEFMKRASKREGFSDAYQSLESKYRLVNWMLEREAALSTKRPDKKRP